MQTLKNKLKSKNIKVFWDKVNQKYWFCAVDVCEAIIYDTQDDSTHKKAKNYWKTFKKRNSYFDLEKGYINTKLTMPAKDGKFYKTDVVDVKTLIYMIQNIKHKNNASLQKWLKRLGVRRAVKSINRLGKRFSAVFMQKVKLAGKKIISLTKEVFVKRFAINNSVAMWHKCARFGRRVA